MADSTTHARIETSHAVIPIARATDVSAIRTRPTDELVTVAPAPAEKIAS